MAVKITIKHTASTHESGTKHYAAVLLEVKSESGSSIGRVFRAHGKVDSASRSTEDLFTSSEHAYRQFIELINKKEKGGYKALLPNLRLIGTASVSSVSDFIESFENGALRSLFGSFNITKNTRSEYMSTVFGDQMEGVVKVLTDFMQQELGDDVVDFVAPTAKAKANEAVKALNEKRLEVYGDQWGSW